MAKKTQLERFLEKVEVHTACWIWKASKNEGGYGLGRWDGKGEYAHRISYKVYKGEIPKGLEIDHLCRNRACVNPEHLEVVTPKENIHRSFKARFDGRTGVWQPLEARPEHCLFTECKWKTKIQKSYGKEYFKPYCNFHSLRKNRSTKV